MRPSVDYSIELKDPSGNRYRWDEAHRDPADRPQSTSFSSRPGKGFDSFSASLAKRLDAEHPDIQQDHELAVVGADGNVWWEGFVDSCPRERTSQGDTVNVQALGWMDDAGRSQHVELMVDRELAQWREVPTWRRQHLIASGFIPILSPGEADNRVLMEIGRLAQPGGTGAIVEAHYVAPVDIGRVVVTLHDGISIGSVNWRFRLRATTLSGTVGAEDAITLNSPRTLTVSPGAGNRRAYMYMLHETAHTGDGPWAVSAQPTVYGAHGLPLRGRPGGGPNGLLVSDMLRYLWSKYYPLADLSGIERTSYPVPHAVWRTATSLPDMSRDLNRFHGWKLAVWENKRLEFAPNDLTKADWQVRSGQDGVEVTAAGDTTGSLCNGVAVTYTDFSGSEHVVTADDEPALKDNDPAIPANQRGVRSWIPDGVTVSWPCERSDAVEIGRMALANHNRRRRPSTIRVPYLVRNGAGDWRPVGEVRAGQTIACTDLESDSPRLITGTDWSDGVLTITTDDALPFVETFFERVGLQLAAANVS